MDAFEARMLALDNFDKNKTDKVAMILEKIKERADMGLFKLYIEDVNLSFSESTYLRELGYNLNIFHGQKHIGRTITCTTEAEISW